MTCLVSMFDAVTTTSEYCSLVKEVFSVLNQPMLSLFSTLSYLLVGNGSEEPEASVWRWITPSEVGSVKFTSTIPLQSTRLYSLFIQLTVHFLAMLLMNRNYGDISLIVKKPSVIISLLNLNPFSNNFSLTTD